MHETSWALAPIWFGEIQNRFILRIAAADKRRSIYRRWNLIGLKKATCTYRRGQITYPQLPWNI